MALPQSPEWWRDRLLERYRLDFNRRYVWSQLYDSLQPSFQVPDSYRAAYRRLIAMARTPWPRLVVDIVAERLNVIGFGVDSLDEMVWTILRGSHIDLLQNQVHREAINLGTSYISVWPDTTPKLAWESGLTVTHETEPGDSHTVAAAIKVWEDTIRSEMRVNLYLPDGIYKWSSARNPEDPRIKTIDEQTIGLMWETLLSTARWREVEALNNPYEVVPVVPFVVRPNWDGYGRSDLDDLGPVFTRIENITTNILLAIELGAFRQRWATGIEVPLDPNTNLPVEPFKVALDRLWLSEDENTKFGSFEATDIQGYLKAVSDAVGQLSATSRIPVTYFVQSELANPPSAASLEASETGLINKVRERQETFGEAWERVVRLVLAQSDGDPTALVDVLWRDPRTRSESQTLDAAVKLSSLGTPWKTVMGFIGYSPEQIDQMESERMADTFQRILNAPVASPPRLGQPAPAEAVPEEG